MKKIVTIVFSWVILGCGQVNRSQALAQQIVDKSIAVCGGHLYRTSTISFDFRDRHYRLEQDDGQRLLKRILKLDTTMVVDIKYNDGFERYVNDSLVVLTDSLKSRYANSVNSVHYFAYLPYGLNDAAVNKTYLGQVRIKDQFYHKVQVTFDQEGGGDDYEDVYVYWFNTKTLKPDYLAYEFHVNGGGMRFREAYNERTVNGIRFVDYNNYKPTDLHLPITDTDQLFMEGKMELLSKIVLRNIDVIPGNYN